VEVLDYLHVEHTTLGDAMTKTTRRMNELLMHVNVAERREFEILSEVTAVGKTVFLLRDKVSGEREAAMSRTAFEAYLLGRFMGARSREEFEARRRAEATS
jgi:hypothetical protein